MTTQPRPSSFPTSLIVGIVSSFVFLCLLYVATLVHVVAAVFLFVAFPTIVVLILRAQGYGKNRILNVFLAFAVGSAAFLGFFVLPTILTARIRGKPAKTRAELESIAVCLETYRTDNDAYPPADDVAGNVVPPNDKGISIGHVSHLLTTPVAYIEKMPLDWYTKRKGPGGLRKRRYRYATDGKTHWIISSIGPDRAPEMQIEDFCDPEKANGDIKKFLSQYGGEAVEYDSSNGSMSTGDILCFGSEGAGRADEREIE